MPDENANDLFSKLFYEGDTVDRELLAKLLYQRVRIYPEEGSKGVVFESKNITARNKILLYLLVRKALVLKDPNILEDEAAAPKDIEGDLDITGGTVRPVLGKLVDDHLVKVNSGRYMISSRDLERVGEELAKKEK